MILPLPSASHLSSSELGCKSCTQTMPSLPEMQHRLECHRPLKQEWTADTVRTGSAILLPASAGGEEATAFNIVFQSILTAFHHPSLLESVWTTIPRTLIRVKMEIPPWWLGLIQIKKNDQFLNCKSCICFYISISTSNLMFCKPVSVHLYLNSAFHCHKITESQNGLRWKGP